MDDFFFYYLEIRKSDFSGKLHHPEWRPSHLKVCDSTPLLFLISISLFLRLIDI
ncbi:hypothetical protein K493DRAFT_4659 [Basidiobolus meristosporus CBS 931.73]|uniref:Uncharacterized protein n=1 Tax=Basidiobolus meristosporus CBS 931.73 TaxID=1314790 RepID=A0A1Y1WBZ6_9FUNG|nr:hypothetical protein K493DRAFT_4659 [Basidiobolus meristosporus CBS 931.73]|eukprot:ORX71053.1 hypothetical protein K493DRAFT_4659 [Basidiobolus meristosporus CBS 931.73]